MLCLYATAQEPGRLERSQAKISLKTMGASFNYEQRFTKHSTLNVEAGLDYSFMFTTHGNGYALSPAVGLENRHYYNLAKRERAGKNISQNSGNYFAMAAAYHFVPVAYHDVYNNPFLAFTPSWGLQRRAGKHFSYEFAAGWNFQYDLTIKEWGHAPRARFMFGYIF